MAERMIEIYWSPVMRFMAIPLKTVAETSPTRVLTMRRAMALRKLRSMPQAVRAPPKIMAERISQMVSSMPDMPRVDTRLSSRGTPVLTEVLELRVSTTPLKRDRGVASSTPAIWQSMSVWKTSAMMTASRAEEKRTISDGTFLYMRKAVTKGTRRSQGLILNVRPRASTNSVVSASLPLPIQRPEIENMARVMKTDGPVVSII